MSRPSISRLTFVRELAFAVALIIGSAAAPGATAAAGLDSLIAQSKTESRLEIYSNVGTENWQGIVQAFNRKYPWIVVEALDLGPGEAFERYYSESSAGKHRANLTSAAAPRVWV